ncbi:MAG: hypothetical protein AAF512_00245 [Pseudomonadota bacterium]
MDGPFIFAILAFFGVFLAFVVLSLLADVFILLTAIMTAVAVYFIPDIYPEIRMLITDIGLFRELGITFPEQINGFTHLILTIFTVLCGALICIPVLPFSATYRQILGANKISGADERYIQSIVHDEIEQLRKRLAAQRRKANTKTKPTEEPTQPLTEKPEITLPEPAVKRRPAPIIKE